MSYQDEPQAGGLIDKYWIFHWIIFPLLIIGLLIGIMYFIGSSCPFKEDVSSCFPYNLPNWAKLVVPLMLIVIPIILLIVIHNFKQTLAHKTKLNKLNRA